MALARFAVRLTAQGREPVNLEEIRVWLRYRFRGNKLFQITAVPGRPGGEFGITVSFDGGERLLWLIHAELQQAVGEVIPGAALETIDADFSRQSRPVLAWSPPATRESAPADRYVNTLIVQADTEDAVALDRPLALATDYTVLFSIGNHVESGLLRIDDALFPDGVLPAHGLWLRAALTQDGRAGTVTRPFFLPDAGPGYACDCQPDGPHATDCAPRTWLRFPLQTPAEPTIVGAELAIYYEATAIHVQRLTLPAGEGMTGGPRAHLLGRLTRTFSEMGKLAGRSVSIVAAEGTSRIVVNSAEFTGGPFSISANKGDTSARDVRQTLYDSHFLPSGQELRSQYKDDYSKTEAEFHADLLRLAEDGAGLYMALFGSWGANVDNAKTLPHLLRHEAEMRRRPPVIQIVDGQPGEHTMLWSAVYDISISQTGNIADYELCPSLQWFGPGAGADIDLPLVCPRGQDHLDRGNVLCPFGFWGLSCIIEQPPSVGRDLEAVVLPEEKELTFIVAPDDTLNPRLMARHLRLLAEDLPEHSLSRPPIATSQQLMEALAPEEMDVVYFYCHSGYDRRSAKGTVGNCLNLGEYQIRPLDVANWARTGWPARHWQNRHPLVVLNGCHTTEATSGTLNSFVPAFTQWAAASGVVGTEVTLEQGLAGWAMELMLAALARGTTVGNAIREVRWAMLRRGNVMGFAYTPYCLANLALRPSPGED
jgi:hypothetical protein